MYLPFGMKSGGLSGSTGRFFRGSPLISHMILNLSGSVPSTSFTFKATGLYFFAKHTASAISPGSVVLSASLMAVIVFLVVVVCLSFSRNCPRAGS